ncbi:hypothetical protein F5876DRAFT_25320, partial [Lentinula aff. lateritia]
PFPSTLGGFPTLTWSHTRALLRRLPAAHKYSTATSHTMHDYINSYAPQMRMYPQMRLVYEAMMRENTVDDEPDAPEIKIYSETSEDPTPPWEFYYTNHMLLSPALAPPSLLSLTSCSCPSGHCHLRKSSCPCWALQQSHTGPYDVSGFMYDASGLLKKPGLPVFECGSLCACSEECRNRVVSQGRKCKVMLKKTENKGWGVFACERIPKGMFIGIYAGELLGHEESEERAIKYDEFGRTYLFDIDWWYIDAELDAKQAKVKQSNSDSDSDEDPPKRRPSKYTIDAYHAGNFTRFLNHSCDPNAALTPVYIDVDEIERPLLTIFSKRDIPPHEEITFSYSGDPDVDDDHPEPAHPKKGDARVHVDCQCGAAKCKG